MNVLFKNCTFQGNTLQPFINIEAYYDLSMTFDGCSILQNQKSDYGTMFLFSYADGTDTVITLANCFFDQNTGNLIFLMGGSLYVNNVIFQNTLTSEFDFSNEGAGKCK